MEKLYLLEVSGELGYNPAKRKPHPSEQQHFPGLGQHEEQEEEESRDVPHQIAHLLAQDLTHCVGAGGDVGHQLSYRSKNSPLLLFPLQKLQTPFLSVAHAGKVSS